jgi:hypothetical protein
MRFSTIWLISSILAGAALIIVLIIIRMLWWKKIKFTLFGVGEGYFFRGGINRFNPFLIVRKFGEDFKLNMSKTDNSENMAVQIDREEKFSEGDVSKPPLNPIENKTKKRASKQIGIKAKSNKKRKLKGKKGISGSKKPAVLIRIDKLEDIAKHLNDSNMEHILDYLKNENYAILQQFLIGKTFNSEKEFINYLKEEIIRFLNSEVNLLKDSISRLRKKGADVGELSFKVMSVPLKIKLFEASFETKDFDRVVLLLKQLEEEIKTMEESLKNKDSPDKTKSMSENEKENK